MNLFFRLLWLWIAGRFRSRVPAQGPCRTPFRVLPTDLDVLRHVNNGVYLSLMDLARVDLMRRSGLFARLVARGWYPVVIAETIQFRRSLAPFERFVIITRVLDWDDRAILVGQEFERRGEIVARALVRARFLRREGGTVPPGDVVALSGIGREALPPLTGRDARWNADFATWNDDAPPGEAGA